MSTYTTHYNLEKQGLDEHWSVDVLNSNLEKIDAALWNLPATYKRSLTTSDDLNNLADGTYFITNNLPLNVPSGYSIEYSLIYQISSSVIKHQYIIKPFSRIVLMREYSGNPAAWQAWKDLTPPITRAGIANYSGLKGGGWADRVTVPITFSLPMPGTTYDVFAVVAGAYSDFPFIKCTPDGSANTVNGTSIILVNSSGNSTAVSGSIYWFAVMRH